MRWLPRCWLRCGICPPSRLRCGCCWGWQRPLRAVPGAALLLFSGQPVHALEFLVIVLVVQQVDGNFIAPRILGSATGISGLWVLAAIVVGGGLFGIPGMVIGVPVLGVAANLAKAALPREPDGEKTKPGGET